MLEKNERNKKNLYNIFVFQLKFKRTIKSNKMCMGVIIYYIYCLYIPYIQYLYMQIKITN